MCKQKRPHGSTLKCEMIGESNERLVLEALTKPLTAGEIAYECGLSRSSVRRRLDELVFRGVVARLPCKPIRFEIQAAPKAKADPYAAIEAAMMAWRRAA